MERHSVRLVGEWKPVRKELAEAAEHPAAKQLHEVLLSVLGSEDHKVAPLLRKARPFVLARRVGAPPWAHPAQKREERQFYQFQLGPYCWSDPAFPWSVTRGKEAPRSHEVIALELARELEDAGWKQLAASILPSDAGATGLRSLQIVLSWQGDGNFLVLHDRDRRVALAFSRAQDGLRLVGEAHPGRLAELGDHYRSGVTECPVIPIEEGIYSEKRGSRAGRSEELLERINWRYATRLDQRLDELLLEASERLLAIHGELGLAYAAHRFNDAAGDDHWLAVRQDDLAWENGQYFASNADFLRSAPEAIHTLIGMAHYLRDSGLGEAFRQAYGYPVEPLDVFGMFRQQGRLMFACCNSQASCGPVYEIDPNSDKTALLGFTNRFDWNFNRGSRADAIIPRDAVLEVVPTEEVIRRIIEGDTPFDAGPPHDLFVPWELYAPPPEDD